MNFRALAIAAAVLAPVALPAPQVLGAPRTTPLITQVKTDVLLRRLRLRTRGAPTMRSLGVDYQISEQQGLSSFLTIGVFATPQIAAARYKDSLGLRSLRHNSREPWVVQGIGDELRCYGRKRNPDSSGLVLLRRRNVLVEVRWNGDYKSGLRAARRLDNILLNSPEIAPKGTRVVMPDVRLEMVPRETTAGKTFYARFRSRGGSVLAGADVLASRGWTSYGSVRGRATRPGRHVQEFDFASRGNVFASRTVALNVMPKKRRGE